MPDYYLYNSEITRGLDLQFMDMIEHKKSSDSCCLILVTNGGDPDAAYKMARHMHLLYGKYSIIISGLCKSAGTLIALGARELIFMPYGELGPLDVQMHKDDQVTGYQSGLNISQALISLEDRVRNFYHQIIMDIMASSEGIVTFPTASKVASEILSSLYSPISSSIDPEDIGAKARAMRIGEDYGERLSAVSNNLKDNTLKGLSQSYPSHSFVIDMVEAGLLFHNVRKANEAERLLIHKNKELCSFPLGSPRVFMDKIEFTDQTAKGVEKPNANPRKVRGSRSKKRDERDIGTPISKTDSKSTESRNSA